jgi:hypothetical protein
MDVSSPDNQLSWLEVVGLTVDEFLLTRPLTYLKQTKYGKVSANNRTYHNCRCGCGYKLTLHLAVDENVFYKESAIPEKHNDPEESPDNIRADKQTIETIEKLLVKNKFTKKYGPKHLISDLQSMNVPESKIPTYKQLQNKLFYFRKTQFHYVNEIEPLVEKLRPLVILLMKQWSSHLFITTRPTKMIV